MLDHLSFPRVRNVNLAIIRLDHRGIAEFSIRFLLESCNFPPANPIIRNR